MKNTLPEEVMFSYRTFLQVATEHKCAFAGMLMCAEPPTVAVIGNVKETGVALADLLRVYADLIERSAADDRIERVDPE